jgi:Fe-S cluster biogenesis protein NfuA
MADEEKGQQTLTDKVNEVIGQIRPMIQGDGGDIELVGIDESSGRVSIRFHGACRGCPMSAMTLKMGVERHMRNTIPEISEVVAVD